MRRGKFTVQEVVKDGARIFHEVRWGGARVYCPYCGREEKVYQRRDGRYEYKCGYCNRRFNDKTRTLLHNSKLPVEIWMLCIYEMISNIYVSSVSLSKKLGINQKSSWLMMSKIRYGLRQDDYVLKCIIAMDEVYMGGSLSKMHYSRKKELIKKYNLNFHYKPTDNPKILQHRKLRAIYQLNSKIKVPVFGMNNGSQIILYNTPNPIQQKHVHKIVHRHTRIFNSDSTTRLICDESKLYTRLPNIEVNNHRNNKYMTPGGHTCNSIENTFSWLMRKFTANIVHCKYHQLYLNEFVFRWNTRMMDDTQIFTRAIQSTLGKIITYKDIRNYNSKDYFKKSSKRKK